jgi:NAD(P)H-nitrite reductase large subunit
MIDTEYLILGAGPAGTWAVRGIRQEDREGRIVIAGSDPRRAYSLPMLSKGYIQGRYAEEKLYLVKEDYYESNGAVFLGGSAAVGIDTDSKSVELQNGQKVFYRKLLISTGGSPLELDVPGAGLRRIYYLRTLDDARMIKSACESAKSAVVIGGSFVGVELAAALRERGLSVSLIMPEDYVWRNLMPEALGRYIMGILEEHGVLIFPSQAVVAFGGSEELAESAITADGSVFEADVFGVGTGIRLNTGFLEGTDIATSRGVLVDAYLETNIEGVFAAGDVAEYEDSVLGTIRLTGHIENAQQQGRAAGRNMAGAREKYVHVTGYDTEVFGTSLIFVGAPGYGHEHVMRGSADKPEGSFSFRDGKLVGAVLVDPGGKEIRAVRDIIGMLDTPAGRWIDSLSDPSSDIAALAEEMKGGNGWEDKIDR